MTRSAYRPLRFDYPIYPVWRRRYPALLKPVLEPIFQRLFPVNVDRHPPQTPTDMAAYLRDWAIMRDESLAHLAWALEDCPAEIERVDMAAQPRQHDGSPVYVPAQWQDSDRVLISFGTIYPPLWDMHAAMIEAISQVAVVEVLVSTELFARAVWVYLQRRNRTNLAHIRLLVLPTSDIWIRDYGPIVGIDPDGKRVAVNPVYDVLPDYPQQADNDMTLHWAAHHGMPVQPLNLSWEGGNLWSDGRGTFITTEQILYSNPYYDRDGITAYLHQVFDFEKLIITPRLTLEETGHVDMLVKLVSPDTIFVSAPESTTAEALRKTRRLFERETNAAGQPYNVIELPTPPLYLNWLTYSVRRSYTNAFVVNHKVLVPVYGLSMDDVALRLYEAAMPDYDIVPLDSRIGIHGGGAVHCMTKEIPCE